MYRSGTHSDKTPYCKVLDPSTGLTKYKHGVAPIFEDEFITIIKKNSVLFMHELSVPYRKLYFSRL